MGSNKKYKSVVISEHKGDEAGIKSTTLQLNGEYLWMAQIRSVFTGLWSLPFDSGARRHTSFASVWVYPIIDDSIEIDIKDKDLRIDTYRSSGAGGQHVDTTDSAVK